MNVDDDGVGHEQDEERTEPAVGEAPADEPSVTNELSPELDEPAPEPERTASIPPAEAQATESSRASYPPMDAERGRTSRPPDDEDRTRRQQRRKLEGLLRESFRRAVEKGVEAGIGAIGTGVDALEKGVEASRGTIQQASSQIRGVVEDVKPKDAATFILSQVDETKNVLIRAVSREVRDFLQNTDLASELQRALTSLSFEIRTEIRFIPNEKGVMKPEVKSRAVPHRSRDASDSDEED